MEPQCQLGDIAKYFLEVVKLFVLIMWTLSLDKGFQLQVERAGSYYPCDLRFERAMAYFTVRKHIWKVFRRVFWGWKVAYYSRMNSQGGITATFAQLFLSFLFICQL